MDAIDIRPARREEIPAVVTIYNLMWRKSPTPLDMKMATRYFEGAGKDPAHTIYVTVVDDRIVGAFSLVIDAARGTGVGALENVAVHPRYRGQGIGKAIVRFVSDRCREAGCTELVHVTSEKRSVEHTFYTSLGFERRGYDFVLRLDKTFHVG